MIMVLPVSSGRQFHTVDPVHSARFARPSEGIYSTARYPWPFGPGHRGCAAQCATLRNDPAARCSGIVSVNAEPGKMIICALALASLSERAIVDWSEHDCTQKLWRFFLSERTYSTSHWLPLRPELRPQLGLRVGQATAAAAAEVHVPFCFC